MIRSERMHGFTLEYGPNVLVERSDLKDILYELNLSDQVSYPRIARYGQYVWYRGQPRKVPSGALEFLTTPLVKLSAKVALPLKLALPGVLPGGSDDFSVYDFFSALVGGQAVEAVMDPVLKGIYGGDVRRLSARTLFPGLWQAARSKRSVIGYMRQRKGGGKPPILVIQGGMQRLVEELWRAVKPHVNFVTGRAERIVPLEGARFRVNLASAGSIEVDGCLVSVAGRSAAPLVAHLDERLADSLEGLESASLTVVHLAVPRSEPLIKDAFGVLFPGGMPEHLLGVMFNSEIFPHVAPADSHLLTVVLGGAQAKGQTFNERELRQALPKLLNKLLGIRDVRWLSMVEWPSAIPQLVVGHHNLVEQLDSCEREHPGIVFAGVDRGGVGVSDRIRIAREATKRFRKARVETVA
jgi:oxygen-dependent protoporphyrinogen oxidase